MSKFMLAALVLVLMISSQAALGEEMEEMADSADSMSEAMVGGEYTAVISAGRARIRAGAGLDAEVVGYCAEGTALTVWLPAMDGWLIASCEGATGYIHESLVDIGEMATVEADDAMMDDSMMEKDAMMDDSMMMDEDATVMLTGGEYSATLDKGRARIRAGAGMDGEIVGYCAEGAALTVWLPAVDGWLTASCYGVTGYIHESLVTVGSPVIPEITDLATA